MNQEIVAQQEEESRPDSHSNGLLSGFPPHNDSDSIVEPKLESRGLPSEDVDIPYATRPFFFRSRYTSEDQNRQRPMRDESTVEIIIDSLGSHTFASAVILADLLSDYNRIFAVLLTAEFCIRLIRKLYSVEGGFLNLSSRQLGTVNRLFDAYTVGTLGVLPALWTNSHERVIRILNLSYVGCRLIVYAIQVLPHSIKLLIGRIFMKFVRVKNRRDRYEYLGLAGLLPSNEAVNKTTKTAANGCFYSVEIIQNLRAKFCEEGSTKTAESHTDGRNNSTEEVVAEIWPGNLDFPNTSDGNPAKDIAGEKFAWKIGTMLVSYSDNRKRVTIMQKAEDRALKIYEERFTEQQKRNFIQIMKAWEDRPEQGILENVLAEKINWHCLTLSQLIELAKQGYSVCKVNTDLSHIRVGAEVDAVTEDYIDSINEIVWMQVYLFVAVVSVIFLLTRLWDAD